MPFLSLPSDIVLDIAGRFDLADAIALVSTCTTLRQYVAEKSYWLPVLVRVRRHQMHPIAVPVGQDLSELTAVEMQEAGTRTNRLMKNWFSESPKPESVREMYVDAMAEIIVIPGTGLVITHGRAFVACWDISTNSCVGRLALHRDLVVESASFEEYGKVMLGVFSPNAMVFHVAAICVDHLDRAAVLISLVITHTFAFPRRHFYKASQVSVDHRTVRVIATTSEPHTYYLLSVSFSGEERVTENILPPAARSSSSFGPPTVSSIPSPNGPYFLRHMRNYADLAHLPTRTPDADADRSLNKVALRTPIKALQLKSYTPAAPCADIVNITVGASMVEFWGARPTTEGLLDFGTVSDHTIDWPSEGVVGGASGVYTLLSVTDATPRGTESRSSLRLLRYVPGGAPILQELKIPGGKTLYMNEGSLALDDHLGLILSLRGDGTLRIISYA